MEERTHYKALVVTVTRSLTGQPACIASIWSVLASSGKQWSLASNGQQQWSVYWSRVASCKRGEPRGNPGGQSSDPSWLLVIFRGPGKAMPRHGMPPVYSGLLCVHCLTLTAHKLSNLNIASALVESTTPSLWSRPRCRLIWLRRIVRALRCRMVAPPLRWFGF